MTGARLVLQVLLALLPLCTRPARAQSWIEVSAGAATARLARTGPGAGSPLRGIGFGGDARIGRRVSLELGYLQASLSPDSGTAGSRDWVDARAMASVRVLPWLSLKAGPHLVGFVTPAGTERWLRWEGRVRAEPNVVDEQLRAHVEVWAAASTDVNVGSGSAGARGGEAGLTLRLPRSPLAVRLAYAIDRGELGNSGGSVTVEGLSLQLRFSR